MTADFYAAGPAGDPRLVITGAPANGLVHVMRAMHDAVTTGIGTILADNSLLSVRLPGLEDRKPLRVVLDSDLRLPPLARLAATAAKIPTLVIAGERASEESAARLREARIEVTHVRPAALLGDPQHYRLAETGMIGADRLTRYERVVSCSRAL